MPNIIDDLFQWASEQPTENTTSVVIDITSNELTRENRVSYAEGVLAYHPPKGIGPFTEPFFKSTDNDVTQYFSDRYPPDTKIPFDPANTDPLTVSITQASVLTDTTITIKSSKWGFTESFTPSFDDRSNVIYASALGGMVTVSLCKRRSIHLT